jgi:hypothetical protein
MDQKNKIVVYAIIIICLIVGGISLWVFITPRSTLPSGDIQISSRVPLAPTLDNMQPASETGIIVLTWQAEPALSTKIYRANVDFSVASQASLLIILGDVNTQIYTYTDMTNKYGTFFYAVVVTNAAGDSPISNVVSVTVVIPQEVPSAIIPPSVTLIVWYGTDNIHDVVLSWTASQGAVKYEVYRSSTPFATMLEAAVHYDLFTTIVLGASNLNYADNVQASGGYYYAVVPYNSNSQPGEMSNVFFVFINTPVNIVEYPLPPTGLTGTLTGYTITLTWIPPTDTGGFVIIRYNIYSSSWFNGELPIDHVDGKVTSYIMNIEPGVTYTFKVRSQTYEQGQSKYFSNTITIVVPLA